MLTTTTDNLKARMSGTRLSHFPQTFQDAISITQRLGIRYLWIDSLCIIQDSLSDWEAESARMGDVYTNSFLTIAATHSTNSHGQGNTNLDTSPLLTRAWAFQERLLSTRTLHVHAEELFWECKSRNMCECTALDTQSHQQQSELEILPGSQGFKGRYAEICAGIQSIQQMADYWLRLVVAYSSLTLTYESDRLQALSGLATRLSKHFRSEYLAGLWAFDLPRSLIWRRIKTESKDHRKAYVRVNLVRETGGVSEILSDDKLSVTFGTPSWSWAAVQPQDGYAISYRHHTLMISLCRYKNDPRIEVLSVKCPSAGETPFGSVRSGKLAIKGALIPTMCKLRGDDGTPLKEPLLFAEGTEEGSKVLFDNDEITDMEGRNLWSLVIGSVEDLWPSKSKMQRFDQALVLQKSSREPNAFERVGLVTVDTDKGWFHGTSVESIIIV
ncbi:hypothetical protein CJF30_00001352 [Rutstroemia sp. NJR-2017a BBW]|nr:hypothetical protein CJF30_00001352 [Rutstroemia sp. NJR-2017a BBW]